MSDNIPFGDQELREKIILILYPHSATQAATINMSKVNAIISAVHTFCEQRELIAENNLCYELTKQRKWDKYEQCFPLLEAVISANKERIASIQSHQPGGEGE